MGEVVTLGSGCGQWRAIGAVKDWFIWPADFGGLKGNPGTGCLLNFGQRKSTCVSIDKKLVTESEV